MKYILYSFIGSCLFTACNSNKSGEEHTGEKMVAIDQPAMECYAGTSDKYSILLNLKANGDIISGTLNYNFYEKYNNAGTLNGVFHGDTLLANYSFMTEGVINEREVAFLRKEGGLVEGYGDMEEKEGEMKFKSPANLEFSKGFKLDKVQCK